MIPKLEAGQRNGVVHPWEENCAFVKADKSSLGLTPTQSCGVCLNDHEAAARPQSWFCAILAQELIGR